MFKRMFIKRLIFEKHKTPKSHINNIIVNVKERFLLNVHTI